MCKITDLVQDAVECVAKLICSKNKAVEYDDLVQEGLLECFKHGKGGQLLSYYKMIAKRIMFRYIEKNKNRGIILNTVGGDRKSKKFKKEQDILEGLDFVSLESLSDRMSDTPVHFGNKAIVPNYDTDDSDHIFDNDRLTDKWLQGRNI